MAGREGGGVVPYVSLSTEAYKPGRFWVVDGRAQAGPICPPTPLCDLPTPGPRVPLPLGPLGQGTPHWSVIHGRPGRATLTG
jgi:hypothetical protein